MIPKYLRLMFMYIPLNVASSLAIQNKSISDVISYVNLNSIEYKKYIYSLYPDRFMSILNSVTFFT